MKGNDLANRVIPKDVLVWEGLLGILPDTKIAAQERKFRAKKKWDLAVSCYEVNELLARKIWDVTWRLELDVELITYHGYEFAKALEERMDRESMPFHRVWHEQPNVLARSLAVRPDIRTVYDPDPAHQFLYGGRGRVLIPETAHLLFGAL